MKVHPCPLERAFDWAISALLIFMVCVAVTKVFNETELSADLCQETSPATHKQKSNQQ